MCSYEVKQGNIFGRVGKGLGQGLAEQLPKEIERGRLSAGLKQLGEQKDLSTFQQFSGLAAIPGVTPQMIESGTKLLQQTAKGQALAKSKEPKPSPFREQSSIVKSEEESKIPSLTKEETLAKYQEGYIPPTQEQIFDEAGRMYKENPALFGNDPAKAIEAAENKAVREQAIADAYQTKHKNLSEIQDNVVRRLKDYADRLGVQIPANIYSKIEDSAVQSAKTKKDGGKGLTEQQTMKEYGKELDKVSRDYSSLDGVGDYSIMMRPANESLRALRSLQEKFEERGDTENMGDLLISNNKLSPMVAYSIAEPISRDPKLSSEIRSLPKIEGNPLAAIFAGKGIDPELQVEKTIEASKKLAPLLGDKGSPLAVAYELEKKGYDPQIWLDYVTRNKKELNLRGNQERQLEKLDSVTGTMNDWWLSSWSGLDERGK